MFLSGKILLLMLLLILQVFAVMTQEPIDSTNCGRVFSNIPGPFAFGNRYVGTSGKEWSAGGRGTISIKSPKADHKIIRIKTETDFRSIFAVTDQLGYAVGSTSDSLATYGRIYATNDGGKTWVEQKSSVTFHLEAVTCVDQLTCWTVGQDGIVLRTINGGDDWEVVQLENKATLIAVDFVNHSLGWAVGKEGLIMKTEDGGITWIIEKASVFSAANNPEQHAIVWRGVNFRDSDLGCIGGHNRIACTSDGGRNWNRTVFDDGEEPYDFVSFAFYKDQIRALERCGKDFVSLDLGKTWSPVKEAELGPMGSDLRYCDLRALLIK